MVAAIDISNPFDYEQSSMHLGAQHGEKLDRMMAKGLVSILEANKVLFMRENKGFDLRKASTSSTVREFDAAILRVTYGFNTLEEFYTAAGSARYISTVQVPLLFIQREDDSKPVTSIPRLVLEKNPYITALAQIPVVNLSSFKGVVREPGSTSRHDWSYNVAFEWLAAVKVALLKGQHPLLHRHS
ncbi:embryogenesis-associated protein EMB8-like [Physcomitrium patens]|uniref:embryogenesis-associated protein EMB8-like n=1 Tax=Physcomitrium patens TaxID=3218 RepID=UPI000D158D26|nr:embryogenesis-associated protein EMB8-like [Physcomitrium patens]|eukprot:XP_024360288.1 embryogenesis-associated protein EMB8-like [Physcomitrella patens]